MFSHLNYVAKVSTLLSIVFFSGYGYAIDSELSFRFGFHALSRSN
jgi:hypothetical protein